MSNIPSDNASTVMVTAEANPKAASKASCPKRPRSRPLDEDLILGWADAFHERHGRWPKADSGAIPESSGDAWAEDTWNSVNAALRHKLRGLQSQSSLVLLLSERRGVRKHNRILPALTQMQILTWADAYYKSHGDWPLRTSGPIPETDGETWSSVNLALTRGSRGLPGGSSLGSLLVEQRGECKQLHLPRLTMKAILKWADLHLQRHGSYPTVGSGVVDDAPSENWHAIDQALCEGYRGLKGGLSLCRLLEIHRSPFRHKDSSDLSDEQILAWADAYFEEYGIWPTSINGWMPGSRSETWAKMSRALSAGNSGLPTGSGDPGVHRPNRRYLARLLAERRDYRKPTKRGR